MKKSLLFFLATSLCSLIVNAQLSVSLTTINEPCFGDNNGSITANPTGGTPNYTYHWSNNATTPSIGNLAIGAYSVTVTDNIGSTATATTTITQPTQLALTLNDSSVLCFGYTNGQLKAQPWNGTPVYSYKWSNGNTTQVATNLSTTGSPYSVTLTDAIGCTITKSAKITQPTRLIASATKTDAKCNSATDGTVTLTHSGGTPGYTYSWSNSATTQNLAAVGIGTYTVTVRDVNNCTVTTSAVVNQPTMVMATATATNAKCNGSTDGTVTLIPGSGTSPYTYLWSNSATTQNLAAVGVGTYTVTVKDANNCTKTTSTTVNQPTAVMATATATNAKCNGSTDGTVFLTPGGGTPGYTFSWSNNATTQNLVVVGVGNYTVTVKDANNCTKTASETVNQPTMITLTTTVTNVTNQNNNDGSITINAGGGTLPYDYTINYGATLQSSNIFNNLASGTYEVIVEDANGCIASQNVNVGYTLVDSLSTTKDTACIIDYTKGIDSTVFSNFKYLGANQFSIKLTCWQQGVGKSVNTIFNFTKTGWTVISVTITCDDGIKALHSSTFKDYVYLTTATGITNVLDNNIINLFPNPATNTITIQTGTNVEYVLKLNNLQGQTVIAKNIAFTNSFSLDLSGIDNGIYFLTLQNEKEQVVRKVVVEK